MSKKKTAEASLTRYLLLVILAMFVVLTLIYSLTVPLFEGPDEIWHYAFANHLASGGGLPVFSADQPATFLRNGAHPPLYYVLIAALIAPVDRSDFPAEYRFNLASPRITPGGSGTSPNLLIHTAREDFPYRDTALAGHLARLVSIVVGALTVVGVFSVARRLLRDERLALIATALVAFIPQFVYGSALINNDALAAVSATWLLYALLRLMDDGRWRWALLSGVLLGVTLLSKIGMIAVLPVPALAIVLYALRTTNHASRRTRITYCAARILLVYGLAVLIAGWWYARNFVLYGDPLMWRIWQVLTGTGRVPPTPLDFLRDMVGFFGLFWADFSLRVDRVLWPLFGVIVLVAVVGLIRRAIKRQWPALDWAGLLVGLAWLVLLIATAVRYSFNIYDIHGRLLYPALSVIGVVLALGLSGWPKSKWVMSGALAILLSLGVLAPFVLIQPAYARPVVSELPDGVTKTSAKFGEVELIGYEVRPDQIRSGDEVQVTTYWRRAQPPTDNTSFHADIALLSLNSGEALGHNESIIGSDAYPSWAWQPTDIVASKTHFPAEVYASAVGEMWLSVRDETAKLIPSSGGNAVGLGRVIVRSTHACQQPLTSSNVIFGGSIELVGYRFVDTFLELCWQSLKPVTTDYTVFVHALNEQGAPLAADSQPRNGKYPTSAWLVGEQIADGHVLTDTAKQISIGLYRLDTGERLPIDGTTLTEYELIK